MFIKDGSPYGSENLPGFYAKHTPKERESRFFVRLCFGRWKTANRCNSVEELKARYQDRVRNAIDLNPHGYMTIVAPVSDESILSLRQYTCGEDGMYLKINAYMQADGNVPPNAQLENMIANIDSAIRSSTLNQDLVVYRGIKSDQLFNVLANGNKTIDIYSFQSTSIMREVSERYAGNESGKSILMKIILPQRTRCIDVSKISTAPDQEDEILLGATGKYSIIRIYYNGDREQLIAEAVYER